MSINELSRPLEVHQIDFRVQSISANGYATVLAYKDARADMDRLDEVCGPLGWKREHSRDNANCTVSIWDEKNQHWVSKEDTGTESNTEKEKGLASDSFKRACFNWGIGRELYDYPLILIELNADEFDTCDQNGKKRAKATWNLRIREWVWYMEMDENKNVTCLACKDNHNNKRFQYGKMKQKMNENPAH